MLTALNEHKDYIVCGSYTTPPAPQIHRLTIPKVRQGQRAGGFISSRKPIAPTWLSADEDDEILSTSNMTSIPSTIFMGSNPLNFMS